jgi:hypothetical protein
VVATAAVTDVRPLYAVLLTPAYSIVILFSHLVLSLVKVVFFNAQKTLKCCNLVMSGSMWFNKKKTENFSQGNFPCPNLSSKPILRETTTISVKKQKKTVTHLYIRLSQKL